MGSGPALTVDALVDGEIVIADEQGPSDFTALQQRLTVAPDKTFSSVGHKHKLSPLACRRGPLAARI